ncbi:unnamed protein product [Mytilus edulis]|uniref:Uncharacterized protein n=1 Tax=Mytilus edulis TaxID=6550 RepID=A0A8S3QTE7_MYTED|nr:unnamed protein product [Mytilus edulis]
MLAREVFIVRSRQETPQYSYECKENGDIVLHGFSINSTIQLISFNGNNFTPTTGCNNRTYSSNRFGHILIPKKCTNGENVKIKRTVVFRAVDLVIDGTTTTTSTTTIEDPTTTATAIETETTEDPMTQPPPINTGNNNGVGSIHPSFGQRNHYFRLQCNLIKQGVVDHVISHVGVKNVALLPNVFNSIGTVEMRFKSEEASTDHEKDINDLPDISTIYLGDKFYLYLKYIGEQDYYISPQNCTAYGDNEKAVVDKYGRKKQVELWTYDK